MGRPGRSQSGGGGEIPRPRFSAEKKAEKDGKKVQSIGRVNPALPQIVISVPHSATRSLCDYLGIYAVEQGLGGDGQWWHFGKDRFARHIDVREHFAHIPVRHPMDVAGSWASRAKTGDVMGDMLRRYDAMFEYLERKNAKLYRVEDIPRTRGMDEQAEGNHDSRIARFQEALTKRVVEPNRAFFTPFYEDLSRGYKHVC